MFQTHAYDAWTRDPYRQGAWWNFARMQLGGFPARMFLFLTGVSLMLRYSSQARRGVSNWEARRGGLKRGLEVLLYGLAFRCGSFLLAGATPQARSGLFKVDILNCIGLSLIISSLVVGPVHLKRRPPVLALLLIPALVLSTPLLQGIPYPPWLPSPLAAYLWDANPLGSFPLFPWLSYTLTGCVVGAFWLRCAEGQRLGWSMAMTALVGIVMALAGQIVPKLGYYIFYPTAAVPVPAYPASYVYRTGMCLVAGALAYAFCLKVPAPRFSPLRLLGQASLLVYFVHIELVYGVVAWKIKHRLTPEVVTVLIVLMTAGMIFLAWWRIERFSKRRPAAAPASSRAPASETSSGK